MAPHLKLNRSSPSSAGAGLRLQTMASKQLRSGGRWKFYSRSAPGDGREPRPTPPWQADLREVCRQLAVCLRGCASSPAASRV